MNTKRQPWIYSAFVDGTFILAPALAITVIILLFQNSIEAVNTIPTWLWGALIIGVDVGHVYATLFRTYADPQERHEHANLYILVPLVCWVTGTLLYSISALTFWRALSYLAVFHFVRQQYGFMMIYGRKDKSSQWSRRIDQVAIYMATLYPLIYWHTHAPRDFDWFVENGFIPLSSPLLHWVGLVLYALSMSAYLCKEGLLAYQTHKVNFPKNILLIGTAISWFVGIVYFNNDIAFTATNVIAHGIPYIALIWIYGRNRGNHTPHLSFFNGFSYRRLFSLPMLPIYIGALILLGYFEEGLWDGLIWTEHKGLFRLFQALPAANDKELISWLIPLLALPQMTHYALDAFIWRLNQPNTQWKQVLFYRDHLP